MNDIGGGSGYIDVSIGTANQKKNNSNYNRNSIYLYLLV
jgi:hypothetical protein